MASFNEIDICIVAGRRPDLLARTLESFNRNIFNNFRIRGIFANIDPIFGDRQQHEDTAAVLRDFFQDVDISQPKVPGFCVAVKTNWSRTTADYVIHLEDDWLVNEPVGRDAISRYFADASVTQVALQSKENLWDVKRGGKTPYFKYNYRLFGIKMPFGYRQPVFTTSPSFLRGAFARRVAELYDPSFDPEKQFYRGVNPALQRYTFPFRSVIHEAESGFLITDIGREWRDNKGIRKESARAVSHWSNLQAGS
jgi:hypothetical protein